jgi:O-antigen/teichoic acid export membrane protein
VLGRSVFLNIIGTVASLLIGFVASVLLARWLGPTDRGLLALMLTIAGLGMTLASVGLPLAVMYFASRKASPGALLGNSLAFAAFLTILFVPSAILFHEQIANAFSRGRGGMLWALAAVLVPLTFLDWTTHNQILGRLHFGLFNILIVLSKILYLVTIAVLVGVFGGGVAGGLLATAAGSLVMIGGSLPAILKLERMRFDRGLFRDLISYGRNVQIGTLFQTLNFRFDIIVLQFFRPLKEVGYYVVAQLIAELVITSASAFQSSVQPLVAHYQGDDRQRSTTVNALRHHGILALVATVGNAVVGPLIILFAFGPGFRAAVFPMLVLLPGMWFLGTGTVVAGDLRGRGRPGLASMLAGLAVLVTIALDLALIPLFGVLGAALASVVAYVVYGLISLVAISRESGIAFSELVIPTRADLALYPTTVLSFLSRIRPSSQPPV